MKRSVFLFVNLSGDEIFTQAKVFSSYPCIFLVCLYWTHQAGSKLHLDYKHLQGAVDVTRRLRQIAFGDDNRIRLRP